MAQHRIVKIAKRRRAYASNSDFIIEARLPRANDSILHGLSLAQLALDGNAEESREGHFRLSRVPLADEHQINASDELGDGTRNHGFVPVTVRGFEAWTQKATVVAHFSLARPPLHQIVALGGPKSQRPRYNLCLDELRRSCDGS